MTNSAQNVVTSTGASTGGFEDAIRVALENLSNPDLGYQRFQFTSYEVVKFKGPVAHRLGRTSITPNTFEVVLNVTYEEF